MMDPDEHVREMEALRERLSRLNEANLRINESLDFDTVLQGVLDSARSLTGALYGVIVLLDDSAEIQDFLSSGLTPEQAQGVWDLSEGVRLFEHLGESSEPLRVDDFQSHVRALGLPEFKPPVPVSCSMPCLRRRSFIWVSASASSSWETERARVRSRPRTRRPSSCSPPRLRW